MRALGNNHLRRGLAVAVALTTFWGTTGLASAHGTVDQANDNVRGWVVSMGARWGQTVTPTTDNLAGLDLYLYQSDSCEAPSTVAFDLVVTDGSSPGGTELTSQTVSFPSPGAGAQFWLHVDLDEPVATDPGVPFFIETPDHALSNACMSWQSSFGNPYPGGQMWSDGSGPYGNVDLLFRTFTVEEISLRARNQDQADAIRDLADLHGEDGRLAKAAAHQAKSAADDLWVDETHVDSEHGSKVFKETGKAVADLQKAETASAEQAIAEMVAELVSIDRDLASIEIDEAKARIDAFEGPEADLNKARTQLARAIESMADGEAEGESGHPSKAIDDYRKAWERALDAKAHVA